MFLPAKKCDYDVLEIRCQLVKGLTVNKWFVLGQNRLFPPRCVLCGGSANGNMDLCEACRKDLPVNLHACSRCAMPVEQGELCGQCLLHPLPVELAWAPFRYAPPLDFLIKEFKFERKLVYGRVLASLLAETIQRRGIALPEYLVPVPLHSSRLRERGYNQAQELVRAISRQLGVPAAANCCRRLRSTLPQSGLSAVERARNVRDSFSVNHSVASRHVALVDDVMTTGHTVMELAREFRRSGAGRVDVWVCARAVSRHNI